MSLYTTYRPRDWDSVVGQDAISRILRTSLIHDRVGHAYIFTGSRGTGKTTSARILTKGVNCLNLQNGNPCHECENCKAFDNGTMLDAIEIDGASNNGVENVRDLIEKSRFAPNQGKYKVYIIDEVHMLSTGAFNALLKTLEEPPAHVKFILATTEIEKVPETIRSRSLRFDFKKIELSDIVKRLEYVVGAEGIQAESEALTIIARAARGGMRDALTLLEQNTIAGTLSTDYVRSTLSLVEDSLIDEVIETIITQDSSRMQSLIETIQGRHIEVRGLWDQLMYHLRDLMVGAFQAKNQTLFCQYERVFAIFEESYGRIRVIPDGALLIQITLMRAVISKPVQNEEGRVKSEEGAKSNQYTLNTPIQTTQTTKNPDIPVIEDKPTLTSNIEKEPKKTHTHIPESSNIAVSKDSNTRAVQHSGIPFSYIKLLEHIKITKPAIAVDLKTARFELGGVEGSEKKTLVFVFAKKWNYDRVSSPTNKSYIAESLMSIFGGDWSIETRLEEINLGQLVDEVF